MFRSRSTSQAIKSQKAKQAGEMAARRMNDRAFEAYSGSDYQIIETGDNEYMIILRTCGDVYAENLTFEELEQYFENEAESFEEEPDDGDE